MTESSTIGLSNVPLRRGTLLTLSGTLDSGTYREVRDNVIKAAQDGAGAVAVDVSALSVPSDSAWAAFSSARWHVSTWPDVPVLLVCAHERGRAAIVRSGAARYVPVYPDARAAARSVSGSCGARRSAHAGLPTDRTSQRRARELLRQWLNRSSRAEMLATASTVATILVDNVLDHTTSRPTLRLDVMNSCVAIAVEDSSIRPPVRHECTTLPAQTISGLDIVSALSRAWGANPVPGGKTVWAVLGPENRL